jgi:hypothetical protein
MKISTALACCLAMGLAVATLPRDAWVESLPYLRWLQAIAAVSIIVDARRHGLHLYASGMGSRHWKFWLVFLVWPLVAVAWYFTLREWALASRTPPQSVTAQGALSG